MKARAWGFKAKLSFYAAKRSQGLIESWQRNWEHLSQYFRYTGPIRKIIYTTHAVEGFHRQVRKVTKTKGAFTSDMALLKLVYLATRNIEKKWTSPLHNWSLTVQQLYIKFGDRISLDLKLGPNDAAAAAGAHSGTGRIQDPSGSGMLEKSLDRV